MGISTIVEKNNVSRLFFPRSWKKLCWRTVDIQEEHEMIFPQSWKTWPWQYILFHDRGKSGWIFHDRGKNHVSRCLFPRSWIFQPIDFHDRGNYTHSEHDLFHVRGLFRSIKRVFSTVVDMFIANRVFSHDREKCKVRISTIVENFNVSAPRSWNISTYVIARSWNISCSR